MTDDDARPRRSRAELLLSWLVVALWSLAVAVTTWVVLLLVHAPDVTAGRIAVIATGTFMTIGLPAIAVTVGLVVVHVRRR